MPRALWHLKKNTWISVSLRLMQGKFNIGPWERMDFRPARLTHSRTHRPKRLGFYTPAAPRRGGDTGTGAERWAAPLLHTTAVGSEARKLRAQQVTAAPELSTLLWDIAASWQPLTADCHLRVQGHRTRCCSFLCIPYAYVPVWFNRSSK